MFDFLSPHSCIFCDALTRRKLDICFDCEHELPFLENYCKRCGRSLPLDHKSCGSCLDKFKFELNTTILFDYIPPINKFIMDLKFQNNLVGAKILGELLADYLYRQYYRQDKPKIIIPVPLHSKRLRERGYNQALEISHPIAKKLSIPINKFTIKRSKNTTPQAQLPAKERGKNIRGAFQAMGDFNYDHIAIVDDVITTGNTIFELCRVLSRVGVKKIDVWCVAKSQFNPDIS